MRVQVYYSGPVKEVNDKPSKTIPDQTMSVRELMIRQQRGVPVTVREALYHDEKYIDDETGRNPATMDLAEIEAEFNRLEEKINNDRVAYLKQQSDKRKEAFVKQEQLKREAWIKEFQEEQKKNQPQR